jgi:hypothetical protein
VSRYVCCWKRNRLHSAGTYTSFCLL